jgi:hypothetical protein
MALRITDVKDLPKLNKELVRIDQAFNQLNKLSLTTKHLAKQLVLTKGQSNFTGINNVLFTWTGGTLTLSWNAGFLIDDKGKTWPVQAGSKVTVANTYYWTAWNPVQQAMTISTALKPIVAVKGNLVICKLFTGTAGQSGTVGGGGSETSGDGVNTKEYKLF